MTKGCVFKNIFQVSAEKKSSPIILEGQEGEVDRGSLDRIATESRQEAGRAIQELKESTSILLQNVGEAVGLCASPPKENTHPQTREVTCDGDQDASSGLNIDKARHHGDLHEGKALIQKPQ